MLDEVRIKLNRVQPNTVRLFFIKRRKIDSTIGYKVLKTEISVTVAQKLLDIGKKKVDSVLNDEDLEYKDYSPVINLDKEYVEVLPKDDVAFLGDILTKLNSSEMETFNKHETRNLWAYAIKFGNSGLVFFRKFTEKGILEKKGLVALVEQGGRFNEFNDTVLTIDHDIDCIYDGTSLYILNKIPFENIFSYMDKFVSEIREQVTHLQEKAIVDNPQGLCDLCISDPKKIKKLYGILKGDIINSLDSRKVTLVNTQFNLALRLSSDGKIIISKECLWTILRVLNDDYLKSPATDNKYESYSKSKK